MALGSSFGYNLASSDPDDNIGNKRYHFLRVVADRLVRVDNFDEGEYFVGVDKVVEVGNSAGVYLNSPLRYIGQLYGSYGHTYNMSRYFQF